MLKELFLQKGWAGKTISRAETIDRLNPIVERFIRLNYTYDAAERDCSDADLTAGVKSLQKTARADVGKLAETIFSCGGVAYSGTNLEPGDFSAGHSDVEIVDRLIGDEQDFQHAIAGEDEIEHQMRTRAILSVVKSNSDKRLDFLREINKKVRNPRD